MLDSSSSSRSSSSPVMATTNPGVQKPHCEPWCSIIACCTALGFGFAAESFHGDDMRAIQLKQKLDAGVDRPISRGLAISQSADRRARCTRRNHLRCKRSWCRSTEARVEESRTATKTPRDHELRGDGHSPKSTDGRASEKLSLRPLARQEKWQNIGRLRNPPLFPKPLSGQLVIRRYVSARCSFCRTRHRCKAFRGAAANRARNPAARTP